MLPYILLGLATIAVLAIALWLISVLWRRVRYAPPSYVTIARLRSTAREEILKEIILLIPLSRGQSKELYVSDVLKSIEYVRGQYPELVKVVDRDAVEKALGEDVQFSRDELIAFVDDTLFTVEEAQRLYK